MFSLQKVLSWLNNKTLKLIKLCDKTSSIRRERATLTKRAGHAENKDEIKILVQVIIPERGMWRPLKVSTTTR